jgi:hypothetical protein
MLLALALSSPVFAEPSEDAAMAPIDCGGTRVYVTSPPPLATDVPIDVLPAGLLEEGRCSTEPWLATLVHAGTGEEIARVTHGVADGALIEVDPGGPLEPETTYTLHFEPEGGIGEVVEIGFTTGTGTAAGLDGGPTLESALVSWSRNSPMVIQAEINVAASADGATIVTFGVEDGGDIAYTSATGPTTVRLTGLTADAPAEPPEEVCVVARQRDIAGRWTDAPSDCVSPEIVRDTEGGGCFNVTRGAPTGGLLGILLVAAGLARRNSR